MNIFATNSCPKQSALEHCDVHLRKMPTELAQMLSTAHRVLDGNKRVLSYQGKPKTFYEHPTDDVEGGVLKGYYLYAASHANHPCTKWIMQSTGNYAWAVDHYIALCDAHTEKTGKIHGAWKVYHYLFKTPVNLKHGPVTPFAQAMPYEFKQEDAHKAYQDYLNAKFDGWGSRKKKINVSFSFGTPDWYKIEGKICVV